MSKVKNPQKAADIRTKTERKYANKLPPRVNTQPATENTRTPLEPKPKKRNGKQPENAKRSRRTATDVSATDTLAPDRREMGSRSALSALLGAFVFPHFPQRFAHFFVGGRARRNSRFGRFVFRFGPGRTAP